MATNEANTSYVQRMTADDVVETGEATVHSICTPSVSSSHVGLAAMDLSELNVDQRRAYNIIIWHLDQRLAGHCPPALRMIIHGEGGTGKSRVLQTVTSAFQHRGCQHYLMKAAYTGVAASLIDGKTTHVIGGIGIGANLDQSLAHETRAKMEKFWEPYHYLALDEMSMLSKDFFARLSRNISIAKNAENDDSFGGLSVILLGDFHQFPPVARPIRDALFYSYNAERDGPTSQIGRAIYEQFSTVVILKEQKRVSDPVWLDFLQHLRQGQVNESHLRMLRSLIVRRQAGMSTNFHIDPWRDAVLVTPRHAVRNQWNHYSLRKMCQAQQRPLIVCPSSDSIKDQPLTMMERCALESHRGRRKRQKGITKDLPHEIEIAYGMKVMVTENMETDLDVANGAQGEITRIVLHPAEPPVDQAQAIIKLRYLPLYLLIKLTKTKATQLAGLEHNVIPVQPVATNYRVKMKLSNGQEVQRTIKRRQFAITSAYAFTDYRSQGLTIPYVVLDIAPPPTGSLNLFNLYVALSRSRGRDTIRLLRDFDDAMFCKRHDDELLREDSRLEALDNATKTWYHRVIAHV
jgi:hypothetical protein